MLIFRGPLSSPFSREPSPLTLNANGQPNPRQTRECHSSALAPLHGAIRILFNGNGQIIVVTFNCQGDMKESCVWTVTGGSALVA